MIHHNFDVLRGGLKSRCIQITIGNYRKKSRLT
jgi:hypothetical protein